MAKTVKDLLAEANTTVPKLSPAEAAEKIRSGDVMVVDVRDPHEVQQSGKIKGAVNVSRGMLEFRADPESQISRPRFPERQDGPPCTAARVVGRRWPGKRFRTWGTRQCSTLAGSRILPRRASILSPRKAASRPKPVKAIRGRSQHGPLVMPRKGGAACAALKVVELPQREEKLIKDERHYHYASRGRPDIVMPRILHS